MGGSDSFIFWTKGSSMAQEKMKLHFLRVEKFNLRVNFVDSLGHSFLKIIK
jgi:hypothetical protein